MVRKLAIDDVDKNLFSGKRVFVRVDFNVPVSDGRVVDDYRIKKALPTLHYLMDAGARLILASHLGRPKGRRVEALSLRPVAEHLSTLLGKDVAFAEDCIGEPALGVVESLRDGDVALLENLRFHSGEKENDPRFVEELGKLADIYVNDAFGTAHRKHASVYGLPLLFDERFAGLLMKREIEYLGRVRENPDHPFVSIIGGAKVKDKMGVLERLASVSDRLLIGGAMAYTFLRALGRGVGSSLVDEEGIDFAEDFLGRYGEKVVLPEDHVVSDGNTTEVVSGDIPDGFAGYDIGPSTIELFKSSINGARMVFWNGPLGMFEKEDFSRGTFEIARFLAGYKDAERILGGGDTVSAIHAAGLKDDEFDHVSTGGGATLEFISGKELPAISVLKDL